LYFLQRFVGILPEDLRFSHDIVNSKLNIYNEKGTVMQIKDKYINMVYWCMKFILGAIINNTLMEGMQKKYLTFENTDTIQHIFTAIETSKKDYPTDLKRLCISRMLKTEMAFIKMTIIYQECTFCIINMINIATSN